MTFTALSYGAMVRAFPVAGSTFTYARSVFGPHVGFLAGWSLLLDYLFLPMINYLVIGLYLNAQFPTIAPWVFIVIAIVAVTVLNVIGIESIARANVLIITAQVLSSRSWQWRWIGQRDVACGSRSWLTGRMRPVDPSVGLGRCSRAPCCACRSSASTLSRRWPRRRPSRAATSPAPSCG
jgi:hypothetical protein